MSLRFVVPRPCPSRLPLACIALLANLSILLLAACGESAHAPDPATRPAPPTPPPPVVAVSPVIQRDVPVYQEWVGTLDGMVNAQIHAQVTGYLIQRHYEEGQLVQKDQLLYEIDPRTFEATLDGAVSTLAREEARAKTARLDLDRIQRLLPERAVSVRDRDNALGHLLATEAQVLTAKAAIRSAQLDLNFTRIRSPITGIIGLSTAQIGDLVGPGSSTKSALTTVSQVDPIRAYIPLSEQDYMRFSNHGGKHPSSPALELILADGSHYARKGKLFAADRQVDVATGTIKIAALFPNPGNLLRPGQFARIRAKLRVKPAALLVPQRAVTELQGGYQVAVVQPDNTVDIRTVQPAERMDSLWVIDAGLAAGEQVVTEGVQKVRQGAKVTPQASPAPGALPTGRATGRP